MRKSLFFAFVALLCFAYGSAKTTKPTTEIKSAPVVSESLTDSLLKPDFAFPRDVKRTAEAFLAVTHGSGATQAGNRLLAVEEMSMADMSVDRLSIPRIVKGVLALANGESGATRSMLLAYAAELCDNNKYNFNGNFPTPDAAHIDIWDYTAARDAVDSLYALAYNTAPEDARTSVYKAALVPCIGDLGETVRDFIALRWTDNFKNIDKTNEVVVKGLKEYSPTWFYYKGQKSSTYPKHRQFILDNLDRENVAYALIRYLETMDYDRDIEENFRFFEKLDHATLPDWIMPYVKDRLRSLGEENWTLYLPGEDIRNVPFDAVLSSLNTDSLTVNLYRFVAPPQEHLTLQELTERTPFRTYVFTPQSGITMKVDSLRFELPEGHYLVTARGKSDKYRWCPSPITITPWILVGIGDKPNQGVIQVLDCKTGKGVKGLEVTIKYYDNKERKATYKTDADGLVRIKDKDVLSATIYDPKTGFTYAGRHAPAALNVDDEWSDIEDEPEGDEINLDITTDRILYRPGEKVRWVGVFQDSNHLIEGRSIPISVTWPAERGGKGEETKLEMGTSDEFGRVCGEFDIPKNIPLGYASIKTNDGRCTFEISEFKLPELSITDERYILKGDSVTLTGKVINRVAAPVATAEVRLTLRLKEDNRTETLQGQTDAKGRYAFTILRNVGGYNGSYRAVTQSYTVEAVSPDGYNATTQGSYSVFNDVDMVLKNEPNIDVSRGLVFEIKTERLGTDSPNGPVECEWIIVPNKEEICYEPTGYRQTLRTGYKAASHFADSLAILSGKAMSGKVILPPAMTDTIPAGEYFISVRPKDMSGSITYSSVILYNSKKPELPSDEAIWLPKSRFEVAASKKVPVTIGARDNLILYILSQNSQNEGKVSTVKLKKGYNTVDFEAPEEGYIYIWTVKDGVIGGGRLEISKEEEEGLKLGLESFRDRVSTGDTEHWRIVTLYNGAPVKSAVLLNVYDSRLNNFGGAVPLSFYPYRPDYVPFTASVGLFKSYYREAKISQRPILRVMVSDLVSAITPDWKYILPYRLNDYGRYRSVERVLSNSLLLKKGNSVDLTGNGYIFSGRVLDESGEPLVGVSVVVSGEIRGVSTDLDGNFSLSVPKNSTLLFSYIGFNTEKLVVTGNDQVEIYLKPSDELLMEVSGYGTKRTYSVADNTRKMDATNTVMAMVQQEDSYTRVEELAYENALAEVAVREGKVFNALWRPMLTTDGQTGSLDIDWVVPNQTANWTVIAQAWTSALESATLEKTFTSIKPIYVTPNLPRFIRVGDTVNIMTAVANDTDEDQNIRYDVTIGDNTTDGSLSVPSHTVRYVTSVVHLNGTLALADSLDMTFRATNGTYGDGERVQIPILPSSALLVESEPFYLNPNELTYSVTLPGTAKESDETELHYTANPMWTVVEALPSILDTYKEMQPIATYLAQGWYAARTARKIVSEHESAKGLIDEETAKEMETKTLENLCQLQHENGGFTWGPWAKIPSVWTTLSVLNWLDQDTDDESINGVINKALGFVDNNILLDGAKAYADMRYTYIRSAYGVATTQKGQSVINATLAHIKTNWKKMSLNDKCLAAIILSRKGELALAREILRSVSQFGVPTAHKGLTFPTDPGVVGYATMLEAFYAVNPEDTVVNSVRQALVCQRRGASWGDTGRTAYAIRAMVSGGADWVVPAEPVKVEADGKPLELPEYTDRRGSFSINIKGCQTLTLKRDNHIPAYGAVVMHRTGELTDVKAVGTDEISITKTLYIINEKGERVPASGTTMYPGQKVIVSILLKADANMTNVVVNDGRPAAFEPVAQTGVYRRSTSGTWYYVSNRNTATDIYLDYLPRGNTVVEYEAIVNNSGTFTTGMATVVSGEDPDLTAHSASVPFIVEEKK